ncbi:RNA ligase [Gordonia phage Lilbeanie]|uniref:RNA ligase n=1 Tax=Gordonia phage Lilbeanie TaxID=2794947 RepID=A0A7T1KS78_9CAUD|nr:head maturation protease [Gordonia phage Lilbeanie]QPO17094.1 RNA ligase [Gordonia phage Lilbeanie]
MNKTTAHLTAAGMVYDLADFSDPKLDGPTALQVDRMGRVRGHLAAWNTPHIGYPRKRVVPPKSFTNYDHFHQGVVETQDGDLPVGVLTLGTGHAGEGDALSAAAHYDNTGTAVAVVRAGEDQHGIWLAGRLLPGTDSERRDELRRSGVSGDWREVPTSKGPNLELVAALAVNVPGFPIPRTETLVAAGSERPTALVAAGIVMPRTGPITREEIEEVTLAAVERAQRIVEERQSIRASGHAELQAIIENQTKAEARALVASAEAEIVAARRESIEREFLSILAAGVPKTDDQKAAPLRRYWTKGKGLARWATNPHPYDTLVAQLEQEIKTGMTPDDIKGLAANYYHAVFKRWPGKKKGKATKADGALVAAAENWYAADRTEPQADVPADAPRDDGMIALLPAQAEQIALPGGDPGTELHLTLAYFPDASRMNAEELTGTVTRVAMDRDRIDGRLSGRAEIGREEICAVWLVDAPGLSEFREKLLAALGDRAPKSDFDGFLPHVTAGKGLPLTDLPVGGEVTFDRVRISVGGSHTDIPLGITSANFVTGELT